MNTDILIINGSPRKNRNCFKISEEISNKLNQNNISKYKNSNNVDKEEILKKILVGNIISMSKGLDYTVKEKIHCWINLKEKEVIIKGIKHIGFVGEFKVNFDIPDYLGLGKSVSKGFGTIKKVG